jgi:hypothetical protein
MHLYYCLTMVQEQAVELALSFLRKLTPLLHLIMSIMLVAWPMHRRYLPPRSPCLPALPHACFLPCAVLSPAWWMCLIMLGCTRLGRVPCHPRQAMLLRRPRLPPGRLRPVRHPSGPRLGSPRPARRLQRPPTLHRLCRCLPSRQLHVL